MAAGARRRAALLVGGLAASLALASSCAHAPTNATIVAPDERGWVVVPHVTIVDQVTDADCGRAALSTALARWDRALPSEARAADAREGLSAGELRDQARRLGFAAYVFEGTFDDLATEIAAGHPVVVGLVRVSHEARLAHFAVVVGHDGPAKRWLLADPALGVRTVSRTALEDDWARAGWVTLVLRPLEVEETRAARASL